ncbi:hypothetical protein [uncultured Chryseobacterium sp.]|uniref:hypothetical protein n=1 Tax=uncultured Chryseobacterium sp. TaxID=259322 RepID=UPI0025EC5589|nr:hypothetical protein [uncultured Chryseobacterium sp.]
MLNKEELKKLFENGDIPRQEDFWEWQASYFHKEDHIPLEQIAYDFTKKADLVDGKVPASQLPSYVDDVLEFGSYAELPQSGEKGKIYITTGDNKQYRWSGNSYVGIDNTQLSNYIPYEGADRTVSLNSQNLYDIKHLYSHSGIQDGTMGLSVINDAAGGFKSNLLIRVSAVAGNMLTFTVKLYSYPHEFYEFQINLYRYHENHYAPTVNWKSGESTHIGKIEFYKDPASGDFYVLILGSQLGLFAYPRVAVTDLQAYLGDQTFNKDHWKLEWDADASNLVLQATTLSEDLKKDSRAVSTHTDQIISGSKTFKRDLNITDDGLGINFEAGNKIYKKAGSGITLKKGSSNQNPRVESNDGTKSWEIIHEGNLQNIVSGNNGWGGNVNNILDPNITHKSGFYGADANSNLPENNYTTWINVNSWAEHDNYGFQLASPLFGDNMYFRKYRSTGYDQKNHTDWYKLWTTNNFNPNDYWGKRDMGIYRAVTTNKPLGILDENNQAQRLLAGGLLLSDGYIDESLVPHLGIYSKGDINTPGKVISDKFSSSKLNGSQIINASNSDQLYIGNPVVDTVYHESGNNHIFTSKGNAGFTVDSNGNIKARNAVNAGNDSEIGGRIFGKRTMIDTLGLDESKYYPVTIHCNSYYPSTIKVYRTLDSSMGVPSYSTHGVGFWCYYEFEVYGNGWGTTQFKAICNYQDESWVKNDTKVIGYDQMIYSSNVVIYVKGGSKYWFDVNSTSVPTLHTSPYTVYGQTVEPTESRIWSGGILMNANTNDIRNAVNDLGSTLKDYVTLDTPQRIDGKKTFITSYDSYTSDGLFDSGAKPFSTVTPSGKSLLLGYRDFGGGQYYPRLGFTSDQTWSLGPIGNDFTIGMSNNDSHILKLNSDSSSELSNIKFLPFHGGTWIDMPSSGISGMGSGGPGVNAWLAMPKTAGEFFNNAEPGDLISRNQGKKIMWGNDATDAGMYLANNILHLKNNINIQGNDAWHTGNLEDYHNYGLGSTISPIVNDLSGFKYTSFYRITPDTSGRPFNYGTLLNQMYQGGELTQLAIDVTTGKLQTRARNSNNGFTLWQKYITDGIEVDSKVGINNGSAERSNKVWFDYNWAETGGSGSVINFSGLNGNYSTELFSEYNGDRVGIRTHNGDHNAWSLHKWLWHDKNFSPSDYYNIKNGAIANQNNLIANGLQCISIADSENKFDGELSNKTLEGTFANFNGYQQDNKNLGFTLFAPTSTNQGIYYKTWYGGSQTKWKKLVDSSELSGYTTLNYSNENYVGINNNQTVLGHKTFKAGVNSTRYEWFGSTGTPAGKVTKESAFFNLGADYGYGISTNQVGGLDIMANQADTAIRLWAGNDNDNPFNVVNFHKEIAKYSTNISINENKEIRLKGPDDIAHSVKHFSDDTDGFAVSTGFTVKPYNDSSKNLLLVNNSGTYVNGNRVWDAENFNPDSKASISQLFKNLIYTSNLNTVVDSGIYREENPISGFYYTTTLNLNSSDGRQQLTIERDGGGLKFRGSNYGDGNQGWSDWRTVWTDHNFNPDTKANAENNAVTIGFDNGKIEMPYIKHNSGTSYLFSTKPVTYHGASYNANDIHRSGFYSIGYGMKETGNYSGSQDGARALIHFETEDVYSASQIQTERYTGNMVSRTKTDGGWSNWVRHWGSNDFTAGDIANWNNAITQSSASEEIILEEGQLTVQPDEFSLKGNSSYDIASRRKLVHVLFREGNELNIGKISRRQTFVIFNFEKSSVNISIEGLKPYLLAPATKITLYIDDEGEVLMYDESNFKKLG